MAYGKTFRLIPAYGRTYSSLVQALADWHKGKDFFSAEGYCSIRDIDLIREKGYDSITMQILNPQGIICRAVINL